MTRSAYFLFIFFSALILGAGTNPKDVNPSQILLNNSASKIPASFHSPVNPNLKSAIGFEKNKGQWPEHVEFKADLGNGRRIFFEKNKFTYVVYNPDDLYREHEREHSKANGNYNDKINVHAFEMVFVGANQSDVLEGSGKNDYHHNYFIGNDPSKWATDVPVYKNLNYKNLYPGIDLVAYESERKFKYDYVIRPGTDVNLIQLEFNGANKLEVKNKNLFITTSVGDLVESVPYAYQVIDGREIKVACEYQLARDGKTVSFYFPDGYDARYELVIDPVLVASTFSGSTANTYGHCATYDLSGNIYTGGRCFGIGYPASTGAVQLTFGGGVDIVVSKLNPNGTSLLYATYLGGSASDYPHSMFVNTNNELYVYGTSESSNYPVSTGCYDNSHNGVSDMIVSKLNSTGTVLMGSTYIGGSADDGVNNNASYNYGDVFRGEIIISNSGDVFITATTESTNFPVTAGAYDVSHNGGQDAVVVKMNSSLTTLNWATFLGGSSHETGCSIRLNSSGDVYVVGLTGGGFPIISGAYTSAFQGGTFDAYVARLDGSGATLLSSTYIGTGAKDIAYFVDIDINNGVYIYGVTEGTFQLAGSVYFNGNSENFLTKLNSSLSTVSFFTVLGNGTHNLFSPTALMVDLCQNIYMAGWGSCANYPITANATQSTTTGNSFHIMVLSQNAGSLLFGSYYGGGGEHVDGGTSRFDPNGMVYQGVCACGNAFPTMSTAFSPTNSTGSCDIAVFKLDFQVNCNPMITNTIICLGKTATINITNVNGLINPSYSLQPGGQVSTTPSFTVSPSVTTIYTVFVTGTNGFSTVITNTGISTVSIAPLPQMVPSLTQAACSSTLNAFDLGLTFIPAGPTPTYAVFWSPIPNGVTSATQTSGTGGIAPGIYNATIVAAHGCTSSTAFTITPAPTNVIFNVTGPYVVNCKTPTATVNAAPSTYSYTWYGLSATYTGPSATFTTGQNGTWTVVATDLNSGCIGTNTFAITQNISASTSTLAPLFQNITCSITSITTVTAFGNPSVNISHNWISPNGGTLTLNNNPAFFLPGVPGTYTHVVINEDNGCSVTKTFTVTSSSGFPTFSVSSPQNFTLGCNANSVAAIHIDNAQTTPTPGGPVSYTILGPGSSTNYISGTTSVYSVTVPGTWTVITVDNTNLCESKVQVSVLQNTVAPAVEVVVPATRLTCYTPSVVLTGGSSTPNTSFNWSFPGSPGNLQGSTITVNANTVQTTNTLIANYTLTVVDNNNTCRSFTVITMEQNLFKPNAVISGGNNISCLTSSVTLTNQSSTNIPPFFNPSAPVIAYTWNGPSPQAEAQLATTYLAYMPGTYTMVARDLNNGCFSVATKTIDDFRDYPQLDRSETHFILDCGTVGEPIYPVLLGNTTGFIYDWTTVPGATVSSVSSRTLIVTKPGQYDVTITNTLNGCSAYAIVEVISGTLQASFLADQASVYAPSTINFTNTSVSSSVVNPGANINAYWNFGNGTTQSAIKENTIAPVVYTQPGSYTVTLFAVKGDCRDSASKVIHVEIPSALVVPNIFTPNGDGANDLFFVKATNLEAIDILIVDRWGHIIYQVSSDTGNIEWDGKNQYGKDAAEGVYIYKLKASGKDGQTYNKEGNISLVR